jgi:hypothetical protein
MVKHSQVGYAKGCFARGFYDQAVMYINQQDLIDNVEKWFDERGRTLIDEKRAKHFDVVLQDYLIDIGHEWVVTIPTLFDHVGERSTMGHDVGGSVIYIGAK